MNLRRLALAVMGLIGLALALAPGAGAFIYWTGATSDGTSGAIERAHLDGSGVEPQFILTGGYGPDSVAVDGSHLYWTNGTLPNHSHVGSIARAGIGGSQVNEHLLWTLGVPGGAAVHGRFIYWGEPGGIWRARKGGGRITAVVAGPHRGHTYFPFSPSAFAFDRTHLYWADNVGRIGRSKLDGSRAKYGFIRGVDPRGGIAISGGHIYWLSGNGDIGRANLNGSAVNRDFITTGIAANGATACGLATYSGFIYWLGSESGSGSTGAIGRATLAGTGVNPTFIPITFGCGLAVDGRGG